MIALTQDMREKLIKDCEFDIERLTSLTSEFPEETALQSVLLRQKVALASLTADIFAHVDGSGFNFYRHPSPTIEHALAQGDQVTSLYTAPPVPEIKFPGISELVEQQGCLPAVRDIAIWDFAISEIKRLNGLGD